MSFFVFVNHLDLMSGCHRLIPMLLFCGKESVCTFLQLINGISTERDSTFLALLYKYFSESLRVIGGPEALSAQFHEGIIEATERQLHTLADKRKARAARANNPAFAAEVDRDEMALVEEIEDFALEDMGKMLTTFDVNHPLLVAVASVRDLGI